MSTEQLLVGVVLCTSAAAGRWRLRRRLPPARATSFWRVEALWRRDRVPRDEGDPTQGESSRVDRNGLLCRAENGVG
ncbi:MAG: hypothetical protein ACTHX2_15980, partial [Microbacterium sp.]